MTKRTMKRMAAVLCGAAMVLAGHAGFAQNEREQDRENANQPRSSETRDADRADRQQRGQAGERGAAQLPQAIQDLDLTDQQQQQIRQAAREHNQQLRQKWQEFHAKHMQAVDLEAAWVAAVRDTLSEEDKQKFDQARMQDEEMRRQPGAAGRSDRQNQQANRGDQAERPENQEGRADRDNARQNQDVASAEERQNRGQAGQEQERATHGPDLVILSFTATPEKYLTGTKQSAEQQKECSEVCDKYKQKLTNLWTEMHQLHHELVKIEADRIQAIEKTLTEEQLTKLRGGRQEPKEGAYTSTEQEREEN
jgi:hypothetical protein